MILIERLLIYNFLTLIDSIRLSGNRIYLVVSPLSFNSLLAVNRYLINWKRSVVSISSGCVVCFEGGIVD